MSSKASNKAKRLQRIQGYLTSLRLIEERTVLIEKLAVMASSEEVSVKLSLQLKEEPKGPAFRFVGNPNLGLLKEVSVVGGSKKQEAIIKALLDSESLLVLLDTLVKIDRNKTERISKKLWALGVQL